MMQCTNCRRELAEAATHCPYCGADAVRTESPGPPPDDSISAPLDTSPHHLRRWYFSTYLILYMLANAYTTYKYLFCEAELRRSIAALHMYPALPSWYFPLAGFMALADVLLLIAIWDFLKWGVYGLVLLSMLSFAFSVYLHFPLWSILPGLVGWVILVVLLWPVWRHFRWLPR